MAEIPPYEGTDDHEQPPTGEDLIRASREALAEQQRQFFSNLPYNPRAEADRRLVEEMEAFKHHRVHVPVFRHTTLADRMLQPTPKPTAAEAVAKVISIERGRQIQAARNATGAQKAGRLLIRRKP